MGTTDSEVPAAPARRKVQPLIFLLALALVLALIWRSGHRIFDAGRARGSSPPASTAPAAP